MYQTLKGFNYMICCRWSNCRRCCRLIRQLLPHLSSPQAYQVTLHLLLHTSSIHHHLHRRHRRRRRRRYRSRSKTQLATSEALLVGAQLSEPWLI